MDVIQLFLNMSATLTIAVLISVGRAYNMRIAVQGKPGFNPHKHVDLLTGLYAVLVVALAAYSAQLFGMFAAVCYLVVFSQGFLIIRHLPLSILAINDNERKNNPLLKGKFANN